jgi:hypothetical protein
MSYYIVFEARSRFLRLRSSCNGIIEMNGKIRTADHYQALYEETLKLARENMGARKAWKIVILNWIPLPGSE